MIQKGQRYVKKTNDKVIMKVDSFQNGIVDFSEEHYLCIRQASEKLFLDRYSLIETKQPGLEDCTLITNKQYCELKDPKFIGQTRMDEDEMYYMIWELNGIFYKTHNKL